MTRYVPIKPGQRVARCLGRVERPEAEPAPPVAVLPSYATADECRRAHPGCEVWSVNVEGKRPPR
jgi:hypothetical protein